MKKKIMMIAGVVVLLAAVGSAVFFAVGGAVRATTMHLVKTQGSVSVRDRKDKDIEIFENQNLYDGYHLDTGSASYAWINLDHTKLTKMDSDSRINIAAAGKKLEINVDKGNLFFHVTSPLEADEEMNIRTSSMLIGIRGTCGWVETDGGSFLDVYLLKGEVACRVEDDAGNISASETITEWQVARMKKAGSIQVEEFDLVPDFVAEELDGTDIKPEVEKKAAERAEAERAAAEKAEEERRAQEAQKYYEAGRACLYGLEGAGIDYAAAYENFSKAEEFGSREAAFYLGLLADSTYRCPEMDFEKARKYYESCDGDGRAAVGLGFVYLESKGVDEDRERAGELFRSAIDMGYAEGYYGLGCLDRDAGNIADALEKFEKALAGTEQVYIAGTLNTMGRIYQDGTGVGKDYAKAMEYYQKAAELGNPAAMSNVGYLYDMGWGVERDYATARAWYEKSAELGNATGMNNLGHLYDAGLGVARDYGKAMEWYEKAVERGNSDAMENIGYMYHFGEGVEQDYAKAKEWYEKAAALGNASAMNQIGWLYVNGDGVQQDYGKAIEWFKKAAEGGNASAAYNIGYMYIVGMGVSQDLTAAKEWLQKADDMGSEEAKGILAMLP